MSISYQIGDVITVKNKIDQVFIYALINPSDNKIFYIGATVNPYSRLCQHIHSRNYCTGEKNLYVNDLLNSGFSPEMFILDKCDTNKAAFWERFYIDLYASWGFDLLQLKYSTYNTIHSRDLEPQKTIDVKYNTPTHIDGKDIHYYRRQVFKHFSFFETAKHQQ